jgi:hypothetical protein
MDNRWDANSTGDKIEENGIAMMNQFDSNDDRKPTVAWVKPTLERLSLKEALSGVGLRNDGNTNGAGATGFS